MDLLKTKIPPKGGWMGLASVVYSSTHADLDTIGLNVVLVVYRVFHEAGALVGAAS